MESDKNCIIEDHILQHRVHSNDKIIFIIMENEQKIGIITLIKIHL